MKSILRATAILSSSSIATILLGFVSTKVLAVLLGPNGYGYWGLLQSLVALSALVAGLGIGAGLVRTGANALAHLDHVRIASLRKAAWLLLGLSSGFTTIVLVLFRVPISRWALGSQNQAGAVVLMGLALTFTVAANFQTNTLNAYHRVGALAKLGVLGSLASSCLNIALVLFLGKQGIVPAIIAGTVAGWIFSLYYLRREVGPVSARPTRRQTCAAAGSLLSFGGPYTASMLVGTGVQLALPILVLQVLGTEGVGFYRASTAVSVNYLGFLLTSMAQDYFPRVSAALDQPAALVDLINQQHRLVMLLALPIILGALAVVPYFVPLVFSPKFYPTVELLEWQLIGDLFRFSSWTMAYVILVRRGSVVYFCTELIAGLTTFFTSWFGMRWFGLNGLGIGFLATYIVYYLVVWIVVKRDIQLKWTVENKRMMFAAVTAALVVRVLPYTPMAGLRTVSALSLATLAGAWSLYVIWPEIGAGKLLQRG